MKAPDLNSRFVRGLDALTDLLLLNLLWLATSIPVVTLGPSTAAVYGVLCSLERREGGGIVQNYFRCWLREWKQTMLCGLLQLAFTGGMLRNFLTMRAQSNPAAALIAWLSLAALVILNGVFALFYPLAARERNRFADQLRNAALLFRTNVARVLLQLALLASPIVMALWATELFARTLPFWLLLGFSALFRLCFELQKPIFKPWAQEEGDGTAGSQ